ncbi:ATP-binding protein [Desulforhopalus singaporensis]|uniref:histidine kinase n=1 Tax=Desulforhopalus singaporensis TaxID=91360 RepID=A0A1H0RLJ8_9BACT|nr:ATP-binding protein [Desulforhopalus singaporensis]SDP29896.1 Hpt domain-containing protein [Desulforhopalus singaporensis]
MPREDRTSDPRDLRIYDLEKECAYLRRKITRMEEQRTRQESIDDINSYLLKKTNSQLQEFHRKAELENVSKSDFLANMSHEIRTPLNIILGMANLLAETNLSGVQAKYLSSLRITGRQLLEILNNILEFSRIEANQIIFDPEPFSLQKIINQLEASALPLCLQKDLKFMVRHDKLLIMERVGDPLKIFQVLLNLVNNAVKFTQEGTITLEMREDFNNQDHMILSVTDTGIGIHEDQQKLIFDRFTQAKTSLSEQYRGVGLGLAISQKLTQTMGGKLVLESLVGYGSTFKCCLPLPAVAPSMRRSIQLDINLISPEKFPVLSILAVDDIKENLDLFKVYLKDYPVAVTTARNGVEALSAFDRDSFDIILMDVRMPVMNGITATRSLRRKEQKRKLSPVVIIAITAHAFNEQKNNFLEAGFDGVLTKPFFKRDLVQCLYRFTLQNSRIPTPDKLGNKILGYCLEHQQTERIPDNLRTIIPTLIETISQDLREIEESLNGGDTDRVLLKAHSLKGVSGMYGFQMLSSLVGDLSQNIKTRNLLVAEELVAALKAYLKEFKDKKSWRRRTNAS